MIGVCVTVRPDDVQVAQNLMDDFRTITGLGKNGGKKGDRWPGAGTVHVRRCAHHMASPTFALHKMKKTFDSFEVSENILQKDSSPHAREGRVELFWRRSSFLLRVLAIYYGHLELAANRCT